MDRVVALAAWIAAAALCVAMIYLLIEGWSFSDANN
jgi:hypothetical protein